jgi:hypothetical protein
MLTDEQAKVELHGLIAADGVITLQAIRRLLKSGQIEENEVSSIAILRLKLIESIKAATGVNYEEVMLAQRQQAQHHHEHSHAAISTVTASDAVTGDGSR